VEGKLETLERENAKLRQENAELGRARDELQRVRDGLERTRDQLTRRVDLLDEEVAWLKQRFFARSSEALSEEEKRQLRLFDEAELALQEADSQDQRAPIRIPEHTRAHPKRRPLPEGLPRDEVLIDIPEEDKHCLCGAEMVRIGAETNEKLDVIPPRMRVTRTVRPKYACHVCEGSGDEEKPAVRIAPMPPALIDKGIASAGLLAYIVTAKFCDSLPLYRQEKQFARIGVELSRRTMADWMIAVSQACAPLMKVLQGRVRSGPLLQLDETTVQVMDEPGRQNTALSYMWVARGGTLGAPVILYHYAPGRGAEVAKEMLGDYHGFLQTDGYEAYDRVCDGNQAVVHVGCWAHARRKFFEAKKSSKKAGSAEMALAMIAKLYQVEATRDTRQDPQVFASARRAAVTPVLSDLRTWLERRAEQVPPTSLLGKAVGYTMAQWPKLIRYLDHPVLTPDTNACEGAIRPFVLGRKNWLFSGSPRGAEASATLFSIIETAKANGQEPYWYLRKLFHELPTARTNDQIIGLAPFRSTQS
jgi:transposase